MSRPRATVSIRWSLFQSLILVVVLITAAILFQRFGAILHPQVTIPERAGHGLL